jgi:hypothetical protein
MLRTTPREIPTWLHGCIDYGLAGLLAGLAGSSALSPAMRRLLACAGVWQAGQAGVTDYEFGVRPWLTMRQHLALDRVGALAMCLAGATMRSASRRERAWLIGGGLAGLATVALSSARPTRGPALPGRIVPGYPPLDTPKPIAPALFIVDSTLPMFGITLPVRMTVVRLPDGSLLLHSPTRYTEALRAELSRIGPVAHLVAPNSVHWMMLGAWQRAFPDATTWAAPGLRDRRQVQRSGVRLDRDMTDDAPQAWGGVLDLAIVPGGFGFREAVLFHHPSRTLVLTDLVLNLEPAKLPMLLRPVLRLFGSTAPASMPPPYLRMVVRLRRAAAAAAVRRMLALAPERAVFAHGRWFEGDAVRRLRRSFRWLLD